MSYSSRAPKKRAYSHVMHAQPASSGRLLVSLPAIIVAACTALVFLAAAAVLIVLLLRPLLKVESMLPLPSMSLLVLLLCQFDPASLKYTSRRIHVQILG